jgi:hypothetical protein
MINYPSRSPLECRLIAEPFPSRQKPGARDALFGALAGLPVRAAGLEVNRKVKSLTNYVYRFRVAYGGELRYIVRYARPGLSRVWRVSRSSRAPSQQADQEVLISRSEAPEIALQISERVQAQSSLGQAQAINPEHGMIDRKP